MIRKMKWLKIFLNILKKKGNRIMCYKEIKCKFLHIWIFVNLLKEVADYAEQMGLRMLLSFMRYINYISLRLRGSCAYLVNYSSDNTLTSIIEIKYGRNKKS